MTTPTPPAAGQQRLAVESFGKSRLAAEILEAIDNGDTIWLTEHGKTIAKIVPLADWTDAPALVAGRDPAGVPHHLRDPAGNDTSLASQTHAAAVDHVLGALVDERMPALPAEGRDPAGGAQ